jgi:hypothetical protein
MIRTSATAFMVLAGCVSGILGQNYQSLVHRPDGFVGFIVSFRGKVVRSVQDGSDYTLQVNVTPFGSDTWNDPVWIDYRVRSEQEWPKAEAMATRDGDRFLGSTCRAAPTAPPAIGPHEPWRPVLKGLPTRRQPSRMARSDRKATAVLSDPVPRPHHTGMPRCAMF